MLSNYFLANQITGKPVRISCPIIMCWIELTVQFYGTGLNGPVDGAFGAMSVLPGSKPTTGKTRTLSTEASVQSPELPPPTEKRISASVLKMVSFL